MLIFCLFLDLEEVDSDLCNKACSANEDDICGSEDVDIIYVLEAELMGSVDSIVISIDDEIIFTGTENIFKFSEKNLLNYFGACLYNSICFFLIISYKACLLKKYL